MIVQRRLFHTSQIFKQISRSRHYWNNKMLEPSTAAVRGMTELQRDAFKKVIQVPRLRVSEGQVNKVLPLVKKLLLKMDQLRPVRVLEQEKSAGENARAAGSREILLHPLPVTAWSSLPTSELEKLQVNDTNFYFAALELGYHNWKADEILKSVLPADEDALSSYSIIGHIVHLNLRDHHQPYKHLIGQVLCDKVPGCRTVVNKAATIDNTYRNFQFELLCGSADYQVETKENGVPFEFDFAKVYWNPRLSTEHERIVQMLQPGDVLYDVFAGVGPFSVPAARKRCFVLANDLNPESFRWLQHNAKRNKCLPYSQLFNKDGRKFILEDLKADFLRRCKATSSAPEYKIHITMNLPAMAVEFLDAFRGLFTKEEAAELRFAEPSCNYPIVHVYSFAKGEDTKALVRSLVEKHLGLPLQDNFQGIHFVRNVAPNKDMYRVSFQLTEEILTTPFDEGNAADAQEIPEITRKRAALNIVEEGEEQCPKIKCN